MTNHSTDLLPADLPDAIRARFADMQQRTALDPAEVLEAVLDRGLDCLQPDELKWPKNFIQLATCALAPNVIGFYYCPDADEDGEVDKQAEESDRMAISTFLKDEHIEAEVVLRDYENGIGAQGDPVTLMQIIIAASTVVAAPAVLINQWSTAAPKIRTWLRQKRGRATLEFVKRCCLEDAQGRVGEGEPVGPAEGHAHFVMGDQQGWLTGPYFVSVFVPSRSATFVYVTDEVGEVLSFQETPLSGSSLE